MNPIIYVLDDDTEVIEVITAIIGKFLPNAKLCSFNDTEEFLTDSKLSDADLFIIDIRLGAGVNGRSLPAKMPARCRFIPFLFISGFPIEDDAFDRMRDLFYFDFIPKPFRPRHLIHRINLLLVTSSKSILEQTIIDAWDYAPFIAVVLSDDLTIQFINHQMARFLGVENSAELVGRSWLDFIPNGQKTAMRQLHVGILDGDLASFGEFTNDVMDNFGNRKTVKWFNSPFEGAEGQSFALSVGVPGDFEANAVRKLRRYWREEINRHRALIQAIRQFTGSKPYDS